MISFVSKLRFPEERGVAAADMAVCRSFVEIGQEIELLIPTRSLKIETNIWEYYQFKKNLFPVVKLFSLELPFKHFYFFVMSWSFSIATFWYLFHNRRTHVHLFNECRELGILLRIFSSIYRPWLIFEVHDLPANSYEAFLERLMVGRVDLVLTTTNMFKRAYDKKNVLVYPNGVFLEDFDYKTPKPKIRKLLGLPIDKKIVGYAGRFLTTGMEKGIPELIKAVSRLKNVYLVCVGGPQSQIKKYENIAGRLKFKNYLFLDRVPVKTLYLYMRAFDVCAMPFPWNEHFAYRMSPLKMFEYMASKNPIVTTNLPVVKEVLKDKINAVMVKPSDPKSLAAGINMLVNDITFGNKISHKAFEEVKKKYTWKRRAEEVIMASNFKYNKY